MSDVTLASGQPGPSRTPSSFPSFGIAAKQLMRSDIGLAVAVMGILVVLIVPLPPFLLDLFLSALDYPVRADPDDVAVHRRTAAVFVVPDGPADRDDAAAIAEPRVHAAHSVNGHDGPGAAGHVIEAFGSFLIGGNFVIGLVVFVILLIVNFVVITKGSGRIAEVAARFTLDAMPGKQMAIDADLTRA